jgi:orotidine-5'-phosphate decarboxylase
MKVSDVIILSPDGLGLEDVIEMVATVGHRLYAVKAHDLYDAHGPEVVTRLRKAGAARVWYDGKFHDIPNTVGLRARAVGKVVEPDKRVDILTVHASGEIDMMMEAVKNGPDEIYAITVLTSLDPEQTHLIYGQPPKAAVLYLARLAKLAGVQGIVCSAEEVGMLAKRPELQGLKFVVPGTRSAGKDVGDQKRTGTPAKAVQDGAHHLVIGRQVVQAPDPLAALDELEEEITTALTTA